ncbi:MAG: hypothetical protein IPM52_01860 [Bacteroidetes bacterium]|nr:hypothetical protein [Bacteroidota bacterium]
MCKIPRHLSAPTTVFLLLWSAFALAQPQKIVLQPEMFYNCSTKGDAWLLSDEQQLAGDPASGQAGNPETVFFPGWPHQDIYYPADVIIDLGVNHYISSIWVFDVNDSDTLRFFTGNPASWLPAGFIVLDQWNSWRQHTVNRQSRFLMLRFRSPSCRIAEIVVYGNPLGTPAPGPQPQLHAPKPMHQLIGVNGFVDDPLLRLRAAGSMREYHDWQWDEGNTDPTYPGYPNNQYAWSPSWVSGPGWGWDFDDFYSRLKQAGITVSPVLQGAAPYITGFNDSLAQHKPITGAKDPLLPFSYIEHADYMYQFAARYGKTNVPASMLKLRPGQPVVSGLGLVEYLENWNEPDKWWFSRGGYFHPFEFAAMCSADFDGHEGSLGPGKGMKTADPQIKMVMGGLASLNLEYVRCMKLWSDFNRTQGFPADVLNFHHYSQNGQHGISPEDDSLMMKLSRLVQWRNQYLPGKEVWLSEFGYDTNPESLIASRPTGNADAQEMQGRWLLRSLLVAAAAGVDKAHIFMLRDVNHPDPNIYNSSGLTGEIWFGHQPKKSWYYVHTFTRLLHNQYYRSEQPTTDNRVMAYRFGTAQSDTLTEVVWCRTSSDLSISNYAHPVNLPPGDWFAQVFTLVAHDTIPILHQPIWNNGKLMLEVSELPLFIRFIKTGNGTSSSLHIPFHLFGTGDPALSATAGNRFCATIYRPGQTDTAITQCQQNNDHIIYFQELPSGIPLGIRIFEQTASSLLGSGWFWNNWGGITGVDALILGYMATQNPITAQLQWVGPPPYSQLAQKVADINSSGSITALDALMLLYRAAGVPEMSPFPGGAPNHALGLKALTSVQEPVFPSPPELLAVPEGNFQPANPQENFSYTAILSPLNPGENYIAASILTLGNINASAH